MNIGALFPGQGSQKILMGKFLYENFKIAQHYFEEASEAISINMKKLCFEDNNEQLNKTMYTQPAIVTVSKCCFEVIKSVSNLNFTYGAGHSVGEYAALNAAEVFDFSTTVKLVHLRGQYMQEASSEGIGSMLAVMGLNENQVKLACQKTKDHFNNDSLSIEPANYNSPGQIVVSGHNQAIQWLKSNISADWFSEAPKKIRCIALKVSAPFHSSLMAPAQEKMATLLNETTFNKPKFSIIQNVNGEEVYEPAELKKNLIDQVSGAVLWTQTMSKFKNIGLHQFIEFGHGNVLSGLAKKIDPELFSVFNINSLDELKIIENLAKN